MALRLHAWLHDEVKTQLDLGRNWLDDTNRRKAQRPRPSAHVDRTWEGVYHDNGSCIDIVGPFGAEPPRVLVLQTSPLVITDGRHCTATTLTAACRHHLRARFPNHHTAAGTVWAVRRYTIRFTSYGPPRNKLQLILDTVDCAGQDRQSTLHLDRVEPLHRSHDIAATLQLLHQTRAQEDSRCLSSRHPMEEEDLDDGSCTMAGANEPFEDASMNTQMPFGTQAQHPVSPWSDHDDDVSFVGINRLEPVLAGNTQRADLKPRSNYSAAAQKNLLSLLSKGRPPVVPQVHAQNRADSPPNRARFEDNAAVTTPPSRPAQSQPASQEGVHPPTARSTQTPPDKGKKRVRPVEDGPPSSRRSAKKPALSEQSPMHNHTDELDKSAVECSWMKGLKFNQASSIVPEDQKALLQKSESWFKPQVGQRFPGANIPIRIFTALARLADEKAALEGAASSGSYLESDPSSGSYPPNSGPQSADEQASESEEDAPTSPVSWHTSPTPPPQRPIPLRQALPPDSSIEEPEDVGAVHKSAPTDIRVPHSTLPASSSENELHLPPSSPPHGQAAEDSDDDMELETSVPQALGEDTGALPTARSAQNHNSRIPPQLGSVVQVEETSYINGKKGPQPLVTISPATQGSKRDLDTSSTGSVVRGTYQDFSSSAVEETRLDLTHTNADQDQQHVARTSLQPRLDIHGLSGNNPQDISMFVHGDSPLDPAQQVDRQDQRSHLQTDTVQESDLAQPEPTPMSAQLPPKESSSGEQTAPAPTKDVPAMSIRQERQPSRQPSATPSLSKRKPETSPPKDRKRPRGHKRLKLVSFGGGNTEALRQQRAESLRRSRVEGRDSSTSGESRQGSVSNLPIQRGADTKTGDLHAPEPMQAKVEASSAKQGDISPRHQSLYATPSPVLRAAAGPHLATSMTEDIDLNPSKQDSPAGHATPHATEGPVAAECAQVTSSQSRPELQPTALSQQDFVSASAPVLTSAPLQAPQASTHVKQEPAATQAADSTPLTVFDTFKAAYPAYTGTLKHFKNQCTRIEELDREDKMVPKWMWDDFIIRNQTDYKDYASECIESGEEPMPYVRFYKDTIRDAVYRKGVVETRAVLLKALQELGVQPRAAKPSTQPPLRQPIQQTPLQHAEKQAKASMPPPAQPPASSAKKKTSRKSLPFPVSSNTASERADRTPSVRHSLPASSSRATPASTPTPTASTRPTPSVGSNAKSRAEDLLRRFKTSDSPAVLSSAEYRNFYKAQLGLTSTTGSTRVSSTPASKDRSGEASDKTRS